MILWGCVKVEEPAEKAKVFLELVSLQVDPKANSNSAVEVDLVVLYDQSLVGTFLALSAQDYFKKKAQMQLDYPVQMQVKSWQVVPGQQVAPYVVSYSYPLPQAAFVYGNFSSPGEHRQRVGDQKGLQLVVGPTDLSMRQLSQSEIAILKTHSGAVSNDHLAPAQGVGGNGKQVKTENGTVINLYCSGSKEPSGSTAGTNQGAAARASGSSGTAASGSGGSGGTSGQGRAGGGSGSTGTGSSVSQGGSNNALSSTENSFDSSIGQDSSNSFGSSADSSSFGQRVGAATGAVAGAAVKQDLGLLNNQLADKLGPTAAKYTNGARQALQQQLQEGASQAASSFGQDAADQFGHAAPASTTPSPGTSQSQPPRGQNGASGSANLENEEVSLLRSIRNELSGSENNSVNTPPSRGGNHFGNKPDANQFGNTSFGQQQRTNQSSQAFGQEQRNLGQGRGNQQENAGQREENPLRAEERRRMEEERRQQYEEERRRNEERQRMAEERRRQYEEQRRRQEEERRRMAEEHRRKQQEYQNQGTNTGPNPDQSNGQNQYIQEQRRPDPRYQR